MSIEAIRIFGGLAITIVLIVVSAQRWRVHPFFALVLGSILFGRLAGISFADTLLALQSGFGSLLTQIGMVVCIGAVMGTILEKTGAMESLGIWAAQLLKKNVAIALVLLGLLVGIPVFCDSGFIVLSKLIPALAHSTGTSGSVLAFSLATGLLTTHTLVPPTPGPLTAAINLGLGDNLGLVILVGLGFSIPVGVVAIFNSRFFGKKVSVEKEEIIASTSSQPVWKGMLPIVVPVVLIAVGSFSKILGFPDALVSILSVLGMPMVALLIGLFLSFASVDWKKDKDWPDWVSESIKDAGVILLITGAGGSFGTVIKASGIEKVIQTMSAGNEPGSIGLLLMGFGMSVVLKTAQGSTTSAMIITSSIIGPMAAGLGITSPFILCVLLMGIGGGGMVVSHANDSFFWVMAKFGRIDYRDVFKSYTPITFVQGVSVLILALLVLTLMK